MTTPSFGKEQWIEMFRTAGMDERSMAVWHHEFESRWPDAHESFLTWLGLSDAERVRIRHAARTDASKGTPRT